MSDDGLVSYIEEHLGLGYSIDELKLHLASFGVPTRDINKAVRTVQNDFLERAPSPPLPVLESASAHAWLLLPAIIFVFVFGMLLITGLLV